jgi:flagellin
MSLRINTNVQALNGHRQMLKNDAAISKSLEKLSSGLKINRGADGAAGLIVSEQLRSQLSGIQQAMDNTSQAISLVQTAEGALDEMNSLLAKAKKLALNSMSGATTDAAQKSANDTEYKNIVSSLARIATNTQYAQTTLLSGSVNGLNIQLGAFAGQSLSLTITSVARTDLALTTGVALTTSAGAATELALISNAITRVSTIRGNLGAIQANALETNLNSLRSTYENLKSAESTIRDVDFAEESASFTRNTILVQSATSMLAQANQLPQNVLKLLG